MDSHQVQRCSIEFFSEIFKDIDNVKIYIDDILIHAETESELYITTEKVFKKVREFGSSI